MPPLKGEDTCEHVERVSAIAWSNGAYKATEALKADNARLKAEVERLTAIVGADAIDREHGMCCDASAQVERMTKERDKALTDFWGIHEGYFRLQAEVNRLTAFTTRTIIPNEELQAQVERLTKAGDAMAEIFKNEMDNEPDCVGYLQEKLVNRWLAAKEGKQP